MSTSTIDQLGSAFQTRFPGETVTPAAPTYDARRTVWNATVDRHPRVVAVCRKVEEVVAAVDLCRAAGVAPAIRAGGHSVAGLSMSDEVVLDLSEMRSITLDPAAGTARVGAGATWADFDAAGAEHGLATTGGLISSTGVAGLTLGGGIGWLQRKHGLSCDNLLGATVVTADGGVVTCSADQEPDLLWGLRGGGGNFGIATELTFAVHPVSTVLGGMAMFSWDRAREVISAFGSWCGDAPDEASMLAGLVSAPPAPFVPAELVGEKVVVLAGCWCGDLEEGVTELAPLRALGPFADLFGPIPYPALQAMQDEGAPAGNRNYLRGGYLPELSADAIDVLIEHAERLPSPLSQVHVHQMGGAVGRVAADATAFTGRDAAFAYNLISTWTDASEDAGNIAANRSLSAALAPMSMATGYVNFLTDSGEGTAHEAYDDATYARLTAVKARWDPENLFRHNHNILPVP